MPCSEIVHRGALVLGCRRSRSDALGIKRRPSVGGPPSWLQGPSTSLVCLQRTCGVAAPSTERPRESTVRDPLVRDDRDLRLEADAFSTSTVTGISLETSKRLLAVHGSIVELYAGALVRRCDDRANCRKTVRSRHGRGCRSHVSMSLSPTAPATPPSSRPIRTQIGLMTAQRSSLRARISMSTPSSSRPSSISTRSVERVRRNAFSLKVDHSRG